MIKNRPTKLALRITEELNKTTPNVDNIIEFFKSFEDIDKKTFEKLKRSKKIEMDKINGALRQCINAHGPITKELIGSASKRIWGSMLDIEKAKPSILHPISIRDIIIGVLITVLLFSIF